MKMNDEKKAGSFAGSTHFKTNLKLIRDSESLQPG